MKDRRSVAGIYSGAILEHAPRVLSMMDRDPLSQTTGCCDRTYWAWKFVDFPGARFQEELCALSFLYSTQFDHNPYFQNAQLLDWIGYGLEFWSSIQHSDGSFDEAYPFERSLAATAFTTFYIGETLKFIGETLPKEISTRVHKTMNRAGKWLLRNDETHGFLSNHLAAAAAALYHVYLLTSDAEFKKRSDYFIKRILDRQSVEGWYEEYGGADPGYQTHGSFYLARLWQLSQNEVLAESLSRSMLFLACFVHPDGSLGGEYASRNTQTYYPAALEIFAIRNPAAAWIAETMRPSVLNGAAACLRSVDIYNYFPMLNNLVFAYLACVDNSQSIVEPIEPNNQSGLVWFQKAGLARFRQERYDAYIGLAKGGVIKVFDRTKQTLVYSDCGYIGQLRGGQILSSQYQDHGRLHLVRPERIEVEGAFFEVSRPRMETLRFVVFRLFMLSIGRLSSLGQWLKRYLVKVLIYRKRALNIRFKRIIEFDETSVSINDEISGPDGARVENLHWGEVFTTIHMGSSRYFINNELNEVLISNGNASNNVNPQEIIEGIQLQRVVTFDQENG